MVVMVVVVVVVVVVDGERAAEGGAAITKAASSRQHSVRRVRWNTIDHPLRRGGPGWNCSRVFSINTQPPTPGPVSSSPPSPLISSSPSAIRHPPPSTVIHRHPPPSTSTMGTLTRPRVGLQLARTLLTPDARSAHILAFGSVFGIHLWTTFIGGIVRKLPSTSSMFMLRGTVALTLTYLPCCRCEQSTRLCPGSSLASSSRSNCE